MKVDKIKKGLLDKKEVLAVHEFHGWQLTQDKIIATAHITYIQLIKMNLGNLIQMYYC